MRIYLSIVLIVFSINNLKAFNEKELFEKIAMIVYLDDWNFSMNDSTINAVTSKYTITKLNSDDIYDVDCIIYMINTGVNNACPFYVAVEEFGSIQKIYKIKGFQSSEFMYFFNAILVANCNISTYGYEGDSSKKRIKCILKNYKIDGLN